MGISRQNTKPSSARPGSSKTATRTPRYGRTVQSRSTPVRTASIRPLPQRNTAARKQHTQAAPPRRANLRPAQTHCLTQHLEQHISHGDHHAGCTFYCYFCYCCYSCCLMLLSFSLLLLLSPPNNTPLSDPSSTLTSNATTPPPSSSSITQSSTSCLDELSCFCPDVNLTSSPLSSRCSQSLCLITSCTDRPPSTCRGSASSSSTTSDSSMRPQKPLLCRPWPLTRSLSSLLLCPPSFGEPVLSYASTLEHIPSRPRTLLRQQSLQQPLIQPSGPGLSHPPTTSQSLGQLHTAPGGAGRGERGSNSGEVGGAGTRGRGSRGGSAGAAASRYRGGGTGGRSRGSPGSWDYVMDQMKNRGLDVKSFL